MVCTSACLVCRLFSCSPSSLSFCSRCFKQVLEVARVEESGDIDGTVSEDAYVNAIGGNFWAIGPVPIGDVDKALVGETDQRSVFLLVPSLVGAVDEQINPGKEFPSVRVPVPQCLVLMAGESNDTEPVFLRLPGQLRTSGRLVKGLTPDERETLDFAC